MQRARVLFILKHRDMAWGANYSNTLSSGLRNSVRFVSDMLGNIGYDSQWVEVIDNNGIDAQVHSYRPTHVIIEALWVIPEKFDVLMKLYPGIKWIVRNHSETPFLACEGIAMSWLEGYLKRGVYVMCNSLRALRDLNLIANAIGVSSSLVRYGPNYYPIGLASWLPAPAAPTQRDVLRVGCFGAIRLLKNQLIQAVGALSCAYQMSLPLEFHINGTRIEGSADPVLNNLRGLFSNTTNATLVEHPWLDHSDFLDLMGTMDISLQVSFSETFNLVTADAVKMGIPVVVSPEVSWLGGYAQADPNNVVTISTVMQQALDPTLLVARQSQQRDDLQLYCRSSEAVWSSGVA